MRARLPSEEVLIANPLGAGLAHYTRALRHMLEMNGVATRLLEVVEPSSAEHGRFTWMTSYARELVKTLRRDAPAAVFAVWPAVGYWDIAWLRLAARNVPIYLVMHDPRPFVRTKGYGRSARWIARRVRGGTFVIVHSPAAHDVVRADLGDERLLRVHHPMLKPVTDRKRARDSVARIRVLGRYKPDRDLAALARLAAEAPDDWELEIVGRDWPPVRGWRVTREIVSEPVFDELIRSSDAIVVPYRRFFQSGIAMRALECGVPVVGPNASNFEDVVGHRSRWVVKNGEWLPAVAAALMEGEQALERAQVLYREVSSDWRSLLMDLSLVGS